jgi:hypothetical protein
MRSLLVYHSCGHSSCHHGTESHIGVVHFLNLFHSARNLLVHRRRHGSGQPKLHMLLRFDESNGRGMLQLNALRQVFEIAEFSNRTIATVIIQWYTPYIR